MYRSQKFKISGTALLLVIFLVACTNTLPGDEAKKAECRTNNDCSAGGCSGQVCTTKEKARELITTCEWLPEYDCLQETSCGCVSGRCMWEESSAYKDCMIGAIEEVSEDATPV